MKLESKIELDEWFEKTNETDIENYIKFIISLPKINHLPNKEWTLEIPTFKPPLQRLKDDEIGERQMILNLARKGALKNTVEEWQYIFKHWDKENQKKELIEIWRNRK